MGSVSEGNQPPRPQSQIIAGLVVGGLGCVLIGLAGLLLTHNSSAGRVPISIVALLFGIGALVYAWVIRVRNNNP